MPQLNFEISAEPVGFIVYTLVDGSRVTLGAFCKAFDQEILEVANLMKVEGGFNADPEDAFGFFLFEDRAQAFIDALKATVS